MKVLITGSSGMLGGALCQQLSGKYEVFGMDITKPMPCVLPPVSFVQCDITDRKRTVNAIVSIKPDITIHAAAYADVDGCERNSEKAHKVNALGTETIALACKGCGALLFYISTDFVFDGDKDRAYIESDRPNPINIYGKSKLAGERFVQSILKNFIIVRSSWLFGKAGSNFVDTFLEKTKNRKEIKVVNDQYGSPTYTKDLAQAISSLVGLSGALNGIYHITNSGSCSWYELARAIKEIADLQIKIEPISSEQYRSPTKRPKISILDNRQYQKRMNKRLRHWSEALKDYLSG